MLEAFIKFQFCHEFLIPIIDRPLNIHLTHSAAHNLVAFVCAGCQLRLTREDEDPSYLCSIGHCVFFAGEVPDLYEWDVLQAHGRR